jgi:uncharacterized protein
MVASLSPGAVLADTQRAPTPSLFDYREVMVPMRDGVRLQTVILTPVGKHGPLPVLLERTPYGVPDRAPTSMPASIKELAADGYIFVYQNLRGRFKSEGEFSLSASKKVEPGGGTIETRDAWDTVDWLVKNLPGTNGRVGIWGVSYSGYTAGATLLGPHPALRAVSEQASSVDRWMNDDYFHYGAFRLSYAFEYAVLEETDKDANTHFAFDKWDTFQWYLEVGPLANLNDRYLHGKIPFWNEAVEHPNYDASRSTNVWIKELHRSSVPNLNVAGFWDQEDPWGPWQIFRRAAGNDPGHTNIIVAGPWRHGGWRAESYSTLGVVQLGHDTAREYRENIEAPFFAYWLHEKGSKPSWQVTTFQTGSNRWRTYTAWPPAAAKPTGLYLHADGTLSFVAPDAHDRGTHRDYVSDPASPVPYRPRPISPTYTGSDWEDWESGDQRFVDNRPDVLTFVSAPLNHNLTVTGEVSAQVFASTSGSDSDLVVKLIDVFPEDAQKPDWPGGDPPPGAYGRVLNGYELPIAMEVRRGRFLASFEHPKALTPNKPVLWTVPLRDRDHIFLKGHRIMIQVQSTWFPLIDRNPQTFVPSIFGAKKSDFVKATQKVYTSQKFPSRIILPIIGSEN